MFNSTTNIYQKTRAEAISAVDSIQATPLHNINVIAGSAAGSNDPLYLYDTINASRYVAAWDGLIASGAIVSAAIGVYVAAYRDLRDREKTSHFFYFRRLLEAKKEDELPTLMGESEYDYKLLAAAAHFYSPDISKFVRYKRQFFCWGKKKEELKYLQSFLKGKNEKETLATLFQAIIDKVVIVLNKENTSDEPTFECKSNSYSIGFTENYAEKLFSAHKNSLNEITINPNPSLGKKIMAAVGSASFIYWLVGFSFYLFPVGIVAGIALPPLMIAMACLAWQLGYSMGEPTQNTPSINTKNQQKTLFERRIIECSKRQAFIKHNALSLVDFKGSQLHSDLQKTLNKPRFSKVHAALHGFVGGCFYPFFATWLFGDLFKLIAGLIIGTSVTGPAAPAIFGTIFMVIAGATLLAGIGYGIYCAIHAVKNHDKKYEELSTKIKHLEETNSKVADLSLQTYDRFLRRFSLEEPSWTRIKRGLNRAWEAIKHIGTGSLVFRLVILGSITALTSLTLSAPVFITCLVVFAALAAAWSYYAYEANSKEKQAANVLEHLDYSQSVNENNLSPATTKGCVLPQTISKIPALQEAKNNEQHPSTAPIKSSDEPCEQPVRAAITGWESPRAPIISLLYPSSSDRDKDKAMTDSTPTEKVSARR